jgi:hypothetical protein
LRDLLDKLMGGAQIGQIEDISGDMPQQVTGSVDVEPSEQFRPPRADATDELYLCFKRMIVTE